MSKLQSILSNSQYFKLELILLLIFPPVDYPQTIYTMISEQWMLLSFRTEGRLNMSVHAQSIKYTHKHVHDRYYKKKWLILGRGTKTIQWKLIVFSINLAGKIGYHHARKMNVDPCYT